jgi:sucrose-6F-phosphate phosphohydrolase
MDTVAGLPKILICSDLDRTLIPNGYQEESAHARPVLRQLAEHPCIYLAYVSGRNQKLMLDAIDEFYLPLPDYAIGDVGTTLFRITDGHWQLSDAWSDELREDWRGFSWEKLTEFLEDMEAIQVQEPEKQSQYKLSFYTDRQIDHQQVAKKIRVRLARKGVRARVIWSVDEISANGLLDIIPARANKLLAIQFLMQLEQFAEKRTIFAGDSGNDLDVLTSGLQAILVKNATDDVRKAAMRTLSEKHMTDCLYLARGNFYGMNGNYAAGLMEGLVHYIPETGELIAKLLNKIK